ncbi:hypothetical protein [Sutcliffiella horikoshii]|uniref:Uncharacterized protein n=1 Tax=Sutcliffiella horikoshii TaxID=79883 RepID=A0A5D4TEA1_9BACI|nr:hypothetical protein [Sutcliffiella horikoshii]TYS72416.1 hypothetical protein FZC75_10730 [Sutcliffiella horikoshii]
MENYKTIYKILKDKEFSKYNLTETGLLTLIKFGILKEKKEKFKMINVEELKQHISWEENFIKEYYTDVEMWDEFNYTGRSKGVYFQLFKNLQKLDNEKVLRVKKLNFPLTILNNNDVYRYNRRFVNKEDIKRLKEDYINKHKLIELLGELNNVRAKTFIMDSGFKEVKLMNRMEFTFYKLKEVNEYIEERNANSLLSRKEVSEMKLTSKKVKLLNRTDVIELLGGNYKHLEELLREGVIEIEEKKGRIKLFSKDKIVNLLEEKERLLKEIKGKYISRFEIFEIYNMNIDTIKVDIKKINTPILLKSEKEYKYQKYLYKKEDIDNEIERRSTKYNLYLDVGNIYENVLHKLRILEICWDQKAINRTMDLWFNYIKNKSITYNTNNEKTKAMRIQEFVNVTLLLVKRLKKEIFEYSAKEINILLFTSIENQATQKTLYIFLNELIVSNTVAEVSKSYLKDLKKPDFIKTSRSKDTYTPEEYKMFYQYLSNTQYHKLRAIKSIRKAILYDGKKLNLVYDRYDSVWLYTLLHLNNAWRHWDATEIPRISFKGTKVEATLEWLEENQLSLEDSELLIRRMKINIEKQRINKTGAEKFFYCSDELLIPLGNAIVLCEIRTRILSPMRETIIDFMTKGRTLSNSLEKTLFHNLEQKIKFKSMKMNRTFITLAFNIARQFNGTAHELELLKFLRNHKQFDTTNIYIMLSQEDINFLSNQLFDRDYFGFISNLFVELIYGQEKNMQKKTNQIKKVNKTIGDGFQLEQLSMFINSTIQNEDKVKEIIKGLMKDEIEEKYASIIFGSTASKKQNISCLIAPSDCLYPGKDCVNCHFAIYNFYALSTICKRLKDSIYFLATEFSALKFKGDKERNFILFIRLIRIFKEAERKYGEIIYEFMDLSKEEFLRTLELVPSTTDILTEEELNFIE